MITLQEEKFTIVYKNSPVNIEILEMSNQILYLVKFSDRSPMMIEQINSSGSIHFWNSVPEGRRELAEEIGELVSDHIKQNA
jgi:hypothetical protein